MVRLRRLMVAAALAAIGTSASAQPQAAWPSKPVKVVVPYPPGGPTDIVARVVFQQLGEQLHQIFIIDNRPGAGGSTGAEAVARSPADGYTLLLVTTAHAINPSIFKNLTFDIEKDFAPVSLLTQGPLILAVNPASPFHSVRDLVTYAKAHPGALDFASSGNGQSTHLSGEMFNLMAGTKITHVPYKGSAPALQDVISGQVPIIFDTMLSAMPFVRSGKLRGLAVTSAARSPAAPDLPTIAESGVPGYESAGFNGVMVPAGTPPAIVQKLDDEIRKALAVPAVADKFTAQGYAGVWTTPAQFGSFFHDEIVKWTRIVKDSGARIE